jgi:uncharacterized protein
MKPQPLTDEEFDHLSLILGRLGDEHSMNLEQLDGFLAALACGPGNAHPSEFLRDICGDAIASDGNRELSSLIVRHWNVIADTLRSDEVYLPLLLEDAEGVFRANDWAGGFLRGMNFRREEWSDLMGDEQHGGALVPILALAHEHDPDPEMRPYGEPVSTELREKLIVGAAAGVMRIYCRFESLRLEAMRLLSETTDRRIAPKIGRNGPCPCGSGRKFKRCCGAAIPH